MPFLSIGLIARSREEEGEAGCGQEEEPGVKQGGAMVAEGIITLARRSPMG